MDETHENALLAQDLSIATSGDLRQNMEREDPGAGWICIGKERASKAHASQRAQLSNLTAPRD